MNARLYLITLEPGDLLDVSHGNHCDAMVVAAEDEGFAYWYCADAWGNISYRGVEGRLELVPRQALTFKLIGVAMKDIKLGIVLRRAR